MAFRSLDHRPHSVPEGARLRRLSAFPPATGEEPNLDEALRGLSACRACKVLPHIVVRDEQGARVGLGQRLPRWSSASGNLSPRSLRIYAYDLLDFARLVRTAASARFAEITESTLMDYVSPSTRAAAQTHSTDRESSPGHSALLLSLSHGAKKFPQAKCISSAAIPNGFPLGCGRRRPRGLPGAFASNKIGESSVPLSSEEVAKFLAKFSAPIAIWPSWA